MTDATAANTAMLDDALPQTPAERLVYKTLILTWPFYGVGALYVVGPVLGWILGFMAAFALYFGSAMPLDQRATGSVPPVVWAWMLGMVAMLFALWAGHIDWGMSLKDTIKSSIGWAKGWALLALFPLAGSILPIRRAVIIRGQTAIGLGTLVLAPVMLAAPYVGLPERLFVSPLRAIGGPGPEYFTVYFFTFDPASWTPRWQFFAPWSPFAALLGVLMVLFSLEDKNIRWRAVGVAAGTLMILASKSRMGLVGLVVCVGGPRFMPLLLRGWAWQLGAAFAASMAMFGPSLMRLAQDAVDAFKGARADSSRVRATLQRIAEERWYSDAFWFGHGRVQPGAHIVEYMPIGSHHTWFGLLFVKGVAGFAAFFVPLAVQTWITLVDATRHARGRLPLGIVLTIILLSFGENIEIQAYLLWPALLLLGVHAREIAQNPDRQSQFGHPVPV